MFHAIVRVVGGLLEVGGVQPWIDEQVHSIETLGIQVVRGLAGLTIRRRVRSPAPCWLVWLSVQPVDI